MSRQWYIIGYRIVYVITLALPLTCTRYISDNPYDPDYRGNYAFDVDFSGFPADSLRANAIYTLPYTASGGNDWFADVAVSTSPAYKVDYA